MVKRVRVRREDSVVADILIYAAVLAAGLITVIPFVHLFNVSISSPERVREHVLLLLPGDVGLKSYEALFRNGTLLQAFKVTIYVTVIGTALNLVLTASAAYVLSIKELPGNRIFMIMIVATIIFQAGIIPEYMLFRSLHLIDNVNALVLTGLVNGFYLILMRNFYWGIPGALIESAKIDGASELGILFRIMIPLSVPALITIGLFYGIFHWNEFFKGIMYLNSPEKWPLQVVIRGIVAQADFTQIGGSASSYVGKEVSVETIQSASILTATLPILLVYPYLQKYFNQGVVLGAVKE